MLFLNPHLSFLRLEFDQISFFIADNFSDQISKIYSPCFWVNKSWNLPEVSLWNISLCYVWADLHLHFLSLSSSEINSILKAIFPNYWHSTPGKKPLFCAQGAQASDPKKVFASACPGFSTGNLKSGHITLPHVDGSKDTKQLSQARDANRWARIHTQ